MKNLNKWWPGLNYINSWFSILIFLWTVFYFQKKIQQEVPLCLFAILQMWEQYTHTLHALSPNPYSLL